ncbi:hypothetical protein B0H19DRAFT_1064735 [Mycena capillaripes]|nr:hypothetical protein B0H19DRAFT_1064735 [Mycena capillaripes]
MVSATLSSDSITPLLHVLSEVFALASYGTVKRRLNATTRDFNRIQASRIRKNCSCSSSRHGDCAVDSAGAGESTRLPRAPNPEMHMQLVPLAALVSTPKATHATDTGSPSYRYSHARDLIHPTFSRIHHIVDNFFHSVDQIVPRPLVSTSGNDLDAKRKISPASASLTGFTGSFHDLGFGDFRRFLWGVRNSPRSARVLFICSTGHCCASAGRRSGRGILQRTNFNGEVHLDAECKKGE